MPEESQTTALSKTAERVLPVIYDPEKPRGMELRTLHPISDSKGS